MAENIEFRTWDLERKDIRERNIEKTLAILDAAGIKEDNPNYKRYFNATMINVNNAYRFSYNGETDAMLDKVLDDFSDVIKDPNVSIEDYERVTKDFLQKRVSQQFHMAEGRFGDDNPYEKTRGILNETIRSGMEMREENGTTYPPEFYTAGGSLQRLVMDIPLDMQAESAMRNIDMIVAKYKDNGIEFSTSDNAFIVKGQKIGPEKFFTSKSTRLGNFLEKYANDPSILDLKDDELFGVLEKGNYEEFLELGRNRAMAVPRDKTNEALRAALKDEVVFHELCTEGMKREELVGKMKELSESFTQSAELVSKESEKDVLGRVDRVMFSVVPEDLATQSTLRNWRSCMHATGCNHQYVDDTIGLGAIVAYGYDSQNPQKSVARLLILPYKNEKGEVAYKVNDRIYGSDNTGFRRAVASATRHFNEGKSGNFEFIEGFYNDNGGDRNLIILRRDEQDRVILDDLARDGKVIMGANLQSCIQENDKIVVSEDLQVIFNHFRIPDDADLSQARNVRFNEISAIGKNVKLPETVILNGNIPDGADLSSADTLLLGKEVKFGKNLKLPENVVMLPEMTVKGNIPDGMDFSKTEEITLKLDWVSTIGKDVKLPKITNFEGDIPDGTDLSGTKRLVLGKEVHFGENIKLPETVVASEYMEISGHIPDGLDLSKARDLFFTNVMHIGENIKLPETFNISGGSIPDGMDLSKVQHVSLDLNWIDYIGKDVKFPEVVSVNGEIHDGMDLSGAKTLLLGDHVRFGKDIKLPENIIAAPDMTVGGHIPDGLDFSQAGHITFNDVKSIGENVKLPESASISGLIRGGLDFSGLQKMSLETHVDIGENVKFPEKLELDKLSGISGYIPDGTDLSAKNHILLGHPATEYTIVMFGKDVKLPESYALTEQLRIGGHIPDGADFSYNHFLTLENVETLGKDVQLPPDFQITGRIADGTDLSFTQIGRLKGEVTLGENVKLPPEIGHSSDISLKLSGHIPEGTDLSACEYLTLKGEVTLGAGVELPKGTKLQDAVISGEFPKAEELKFVENTTFRDITIPAGRNLRDALPYTENDKFHFTGKCHFDEGVEFPSSLTFNDATVTGDLSSMRIGATFTGESRIETDKLPPEVTFNDAKVISGDLSGRKVYVNGETEFSADVKLSDNMNFTNTRIADGTQLTDMEHISLDNTVVGQNVKISGSSHNEFNNVTFDSGCDLSECYKLRCEGTCEFAEGIKYPPDISFSNAVIKGDLSAANSVSLHDNMEIAPETKLPPEVEIGSYGSVAVKGDLSSAEHLIIGHSDQIDLSNVTGYPKKMTVEGKLPDGVDLSQVEQLTLTKEFSVGKDVKISDNTEIILKDVAISKDFNMDQFKNIRFEGVVMAQDAESLQKVLQSDAQCIMAEKTYLQPGTKISGDRAMVILDEDGNPYSHIPDEKSKKNLMALLEIEDENALKQKLNIVSPEEMSQKFGIEFTKLQASEPEKKVAEPVVAKAEVKEAAEPVAETERNGKMPKLASIEKDLAAMSAETGTAMFSYNELHHGKVDSALHLDYKKVIDGVSKAQHITPLEAEKELLRTEALRPLPNGEYMVDVGYTTRNGGGRNHDGVVFFTFSDADTHNKYHEMAHSYQKQQDLFNDAKLDKMYAVSEQGLKAGESKEDKLAERAMYKAYLKEAHSEIFAQTAMMLRKRTTLGFMEQALYAQSYGEARNAEGFIAGIMDKDTGKKAKLYACKPVMHAAIKDVAAIRKAGKRAEYFNPDGTLNAKKVSQLCEKIVLSSAYSPRTFKAFTETDFTDSHSPQEKDWKKGTLLAAVKLLPAKMVMSVKESGKNMKRIFDKLKHDFLRTKDKGKLQKMTAERKISDDPKRQAIDDYAYIQAKIQLAGKNTRFANADEVVQDWVGQMHKKDLTSADLQQMAHTLQSPGCLPVLTEINSIVKSHKDDPYFKAIMENPGNIVDIRNGKKIQLEQEQPEVTKEVPLSDKEKIAELSGRTGSKPSYSKAEEENIAPATPQQAKAEPQKASAPLDMSAEPKEKVSGMSKKEKGKFFHNLRLGINTIMNKVESGIAAVKGNSQTKIQAKAKAQENTVQTKITPTTIARGKGGNEM